MLLNRLSSTNIKIIWLIIPQKNRFSRVKKVN